MHDGSFIFQGFSALLLLTPERMIGQAIKGNYEKEALLYSAAMPG